MAAGQAAEDALVWGWMEKSSRGCCRGSEGSTASSSQLWLRIGKQGAAVARCIGSWSSQPRGRNGAGSRQQAAAAYQDT